MSDSPVISSTDSTTKHTPMMVQYTTIKQEHPDALLFYRMGDFYELFFDDAVMAAKALDIALTKRGKHQGNDIPMCGVPVHSADGYLQKLIRLGFHVAVCEQTEDPREAKKRGTKAVVERAVVRLITPGTLTEESLLPARSSNFLAAFTVIGNAGGLAWVDLSLRAVSVTPCSILQLGGTLARLTPREVLIESEQPPYQTLIEDSGAVCVPLAQTYFDKKRAIQRLCDLYNVTTLDGFANFSNTQIKALGALIGYLDMTQKQAIHTLTPPTIEEPAVHMHMDATTRSSIELVHAANGGRNGSLLDLIDKTVTSAGARLLHHWVSAPSIQCSVITNRQRVLAALLDNPYALDNIRTHLRGYPDLERALTRLILDRALPRDYVAIKQALFVTAQVHEILTDMGNDAPPVLDKIRTALGGHHGMLEHLHQALVDPPPAVFGDGTAIARGYHYDLDSLRDVRLKTQDFISKLQDKVRALSKIQSLKIKHNNVLGYFIEVTVQHIQKMLSAPLSTHFIHKQTTANAGRFTNAELTALEADIASADAQITDMEKQILTTIRKAIIAKSDILRTLALAIAEIDCFAAMAYVASKHEWVCPVVDDSTRLMIQGGRHPMVEQARQQERVTFINNDCCLNTHPASEQEQQDGFIWLLTGPNMGGKSTFLRQNALITVLAHIGSYVPAKSAHIGLVSQIFSRVGAADDLAKGRSTFMVEMTETASILHQANERALVILDEIGRGTATYDGLAIAWATLEHVHNVNRARTLFATHYHELTALAEQLSGLSNRSVQVRDWQGKIVFLYRIQPGAVDKSYGVHVARLAGLPQTVIERAESILAVLEQHASSTSGHLTPKIKMQDLPLFNYNKPPKEIEANVPTPPPPPPARSAIECALANTDLDSFTPKQALDWLYRLQQQARDKQ